MEFKYNNMMIVNQVTFKKLNLSSVAQLGLSSPLTQKTKKT